jgi:hypothetical protein
MWTAFLILMALISFGLLIAMLAFQVSIVWMDRRYRNMLERERRRRDAIYSETLRGK